MTPADKSTLNSRAMPWADLFCIVLLCFVAFANSVPGPFVWDDRPLVLQNESIRSLRNVPVQFCGGPSHSGARDAGAPGGRYQPLVLVSLTLDHRLWGLNPPGYHLTNILFHALVSSLIYFFVNLFYRRGVALVSALLFAAHPIHINAVTHISGRGDSLAAAFSIASIIAYSLFALRTDGRRISLLALSGALFFLALLSNESSVVVIPLIATLDLLLIHGGRLRLWIRCLPFYLVHVSVLVLHLLFRWQAVGMPPGLFRSFGPSLPNRLEAAAQAIVSLLTVFVMPSGQHFERFVRVPMRLGEPEYVLSVLLVSSLLAGSFGAIRTRPRAAFMMLWFWISFLPASNVIPIYAPISKTAIFTGEQFMYLPSVGLCGLLGLLALTSVEALDRPGFSIKRSAQAAVAIALAALCLVTIRYNTHWRDPMRFYGEVVRQTPLSHRAHNDLGAELSKRGLYEEAEAEFERALEIYPSSINALHNLALLYERQGKVERAAEIYYDILNRYPRDSEAQLLLGVSLLKRADFGNALTHLRASVQLNENSAEAHSALGTLMIALNRQREARTHLEMATAIKPTLVAARINLGSVYETMGLYHLATQQYSSALQLRPSLEFLRNSVERARRISEDNGQ